MTRLTIAVASHLGLVRDRNEDALGLNGWLLSTDTAAPLGFSFDLLEPGTACCVALADGMGGHAAGDRAAALTARLVSEPGPMADAADVSARIAQVDAAVTGVAQRDADAADMGSTVVAVRVTARGALVFNVGDSRAYRLDGGYLGQLSVDDRTGAEGEDSGRLTAAIGRGAGQATHLAELSISAIGRLLLCSDGLWEVVDEETIERLVAGNGPAAAADRLIEEALRRGGPDNVSVVVIDAELD